MSAGRLEKRPPDGTVGRGAGRRMGGAGKVRREGAPYGVGAAPRPAPCVSLGHIIMALARRGWQGVCGAQHGAMRVVVRREGAPYGVGAAASPARCLRLEDGRGAGWPMDGSGNGAP
ncbi:hypothetical protein GCM10017056_30380 [Seohaeicola zhoushanensis]|uniref:Uncharacterized protein n=1 Tax=Seohaeicola zhoushanensis TaxID=1569283 RepID=A0A8J3M925_9RHOB|nr:hypothetical protein GCM10017056_30380 [Seohaeicola zhoushanensis]